ncbi:MAG TPA: protocatechuate 3,4-dioxygenase subunit alpha [Nocardioidaceae bacterium]|nr:protocatechuate 3,4-dioxygenase subunit alpha [Nocardioidaceae bacterium]
MTESAQSEPYRYEVTDLTASAGPTPWQTVGPFFHDALPYEAGGDVVGSDRPGAFTVSGQVLDGEGTPLPDALVEVWQADEAGRFHTQPGIYRTPQADGFRGFGRCATDAEGRFRFRTVKPAGVPTTDGTPQAPHLAVSVFARGMLRRLVTRMYFPGETANAADPLLACVPADRRDTLVARELPDGYRFDVHIHGDHETVFLDVGH